ncbi:MerR family transcriptional regulator [Marinicrinis sediminis]|uniref:MerR family transcriptional regulator n=1 Tax=Marinicrinis sediminis TaxID=1652465 RepID=A0ABW5R7Z8_9BACL
MLDNQEHNRLYTIKEAAMRTGLSTQLIRKWEERYEAVKPSRFPNGYRGYTQYDIETLIWLKNKVDEGMPIGLAVQDHQHQSGSGQIMLDQSEKRETASVSEVEDYQNRLLTFFLQLDYNGAQRFFDRLTGLHHLDFVLREVLQPVLIHIGELWESGEISEFQEHFGSNFVRERVQAVKNLFPLTDNAPLIVTSCGPGERHEIGILYFGYYAMLEGYQFVYLGASPSEKGILDCLDQFQPVAFAFSFSTHEHLKKAMPFLQKLDRQILERELKTHVFIGGRSIAHDQFMEGTQRVHMLSGDAKEAVKKMVKVIQKV